MYKDLGELIKREIANSEHLQVLNENKKVSRRGGQVARDARKSYKKEVKKSAIPNQNAL